MPPDAEVIELPHRCDFHTEGPTPNDIQRCISRNTLWNDLFQGWLCIVHNASYTQARRRHPAGRALPTVHTDELDH